MIYRTHRYNEDGNVGSSLGYVHLCYGHITIQHICKRLFEANMIPEKWFAANELQMAPALSKIRNVSSYVVARKAPRRNNLFYLCAIGPAFEQEGIYTKDYVSSTSYGGLIGTTTGNYNEYTQAYIPAYINQPNANQIRVAPAPPPPQHQIDPLEAQRMIETVQERMRRAQEDMRRVMDEQIFGVPDPNDI